MDKNGKFEMMAVAIASGSSVKDASEQIGISPRHGYRVAGRDNFQKRVSEIRTELMTQALGQLSAASTRATERILALVESDDHSVALRASVAILDRFSRLSESVDLRKRIEALEQKEQAK
jgi:hypothetical protein